MLRGSVTCNPAGFSVPPSGHLVPLYIPVASGKQDWVTELVTEAVCLSPSLISVLIPDRCQNPGGWLSARLEISHHHGDLMGITVCWVRNQCLYPKQVWKLTASCLFSPLSPEWDRDNRKCYFLSPWLTSSEVDTPRNESSITSIFLFDRGGCKICTSNPPQHHTVYPHYLPLRVTDVQHVGWGISDADVTYSIYTCRLVMRYEKGALVIFPVSLSAFAGCQDPSVFMKAGAGVILGHLSSWNTHACRHAQGDMYRASVHAHFSINPQTTPAWPICWVFFIFISPTQMKIRGWQYLVDEAGRCEKNKLDFKQTDSRT